jgi:hypothetical protein
MRAPPELCRDNIQALGRLTPSALSYRGLLHAHPSAAHRSIDGFESGLHHLDVLSHGCTTTNPAEVTAAVEIIRGLIGRTWNDRSNEDQPVHRSLAGTDILVVAPFNRMVRALDQEIRDAGLDGVRVGTVDRFQGQEAPVVLMTLTRFGGRGSTAWAGVSPLPKPTQCSSVPRSSAFRAYLLTIAGSDAGHDR